MSFGLIMPRRCGGWDGTQSPQVCVRGGSHARGRTLSTVSTDGSGQPRGRTASITTWLVTDLYMIPIGYRHDPVITKHVL